MINFVETGLAMESSSTSSTPLPLAVFLNSQPNTLFDTHMSEMYTAVVALEASDPSSSESAAVFIYGIRGLATRQARASATCCTMSSPRTTRNTVRSSFYERTHPNHESTRRHNRPKHHQIGEIFFQQPRYERGSSREVRGYGADIDTSLFNLWYRTRCVVFG